MAACRRVHDSLHLQANCQEPGSAPEPYDRYSSMGYLFCYCFCACRHCDSSAAAAAAAAAGGCHGDVDEDADVAAERRRVLRGSGRRDLLQIRNLSKVCSTDPDPDPNLSEEVTYCTRCTDAVRHTHTHTLGQLSLASLRGRLIEYQLRLG